MSAMMASALAQANPPAIHDEIPPDPLPKVPQELKDLKQWVLWDPGGDGRPINKTPMCATRSTGASSTKPEDWSSYEAAVRAARRRGRSLGFVFSSEDPYAGVDLDDCVDLQTGAIEAWARDLITKLDTYAEISPSGTGVKLWVRAEMPGGSGRKAKVGNGAFEAYSEGRYFTMTGRHVPGTPLTIEARQQQLDEVLSRLLPPKHNAPSPLANGVLTQRRPEDEALVALDDEAVIRRAMSAANGAKFRALWEGNHDHGSGSEADLALCSILAYWTDGHPSDVDRLFRQSALLREKWDEHRGKQTYGEITVGKACEPYLKKRAEAAAADTGLPSLAEWMTAGHKNDAGNAERLRALYGRDLLYSRLERSWLAWDGCRWVPDPGGRVYRFAKRAMAEYLRQAVEAGNMDQERFARDSLNDNRIRAALNSLRADVEIDPVDMDSHPLLLNFTNGTVDLQTGILREHRREDRITKLVHCDYDATAAAPTFQKVLAHVTGRSQAMLDYLQRVFGYALTGKTGEKAFWVFFGPSGTGKTTVLNAIRNTFAEYSTSLQIETLMADRSSGLSNNQQSDLADLRGARFAQTSEVESGQRLKEGLIKRLTQGTGLIKVARKFQEQVQFAESHKLFIDANHRPEIKDGVGVWERLHCVPFLKVVPTEEQDQNVHDKLDAESAGIAAWVVEGALAWLHDGRLVKPREVVAAGSAYQESQDTMGEWIAESCELGPDMSGACGRLLESFNHYVGEFGGRSLDARRFKERLLARGGIIEKRRTDARLYLGIGLKSEFGNAHVA